MRFIYNKPASPNSTAARPPTGATIWLATPVNSAVASACVADAVVVSATLSVLVGTTTAEVATTVGTGMVAASAKDFEIKL